MKTSRDVCMTIGKSTYTINTPLDIEALERVKGLIDDACGEIVKGASQEDMLMITCMRLAYSLDVVNSKLRRILEHIDNEV